MNIFKQSPWDMPKNDFFQKNRNNGPKMSFDNFGDFNKLPIKKILFGLLVLWLLSGVYKVHEGSRGAVVRFGAFVRMSEPGLSYHLPSPIENVFIAKVDESRRIEIGYRSVSRFNRGSSSQSNAQLVPEESIMLTGDENLMSMNCDVIWRIKDISHYLFNIDNIENTIKIVTESAIREVVANTPLSFALSSRKEEVALKIKELTQKTLDSYASGVHVAEVLLLKAEPPAEVKDAYRDVQTARADKEREINLAQSYKNDLIPKARGGSAKIIEEAEGYKQEMIAMAKGESERFRALLVQYSLNKQVTKDRLHFEAIESVLKDSKKIIVGKDQILPHMSLNK